MQLAFGDAVSFVYVWTMYFVLSTGSLAIVSTTFAQYLLAGVSIVVMVYLAAAVFS